MTSEETSQPAAELPRGVRKVARGWEIDLDYSIEKDGEELATLKIRRATIGVLEVMSRYADDDDDDSAKNFELLVILISRMTGLTEDETRTIDAEDFPRIQEVIQPHLEKLNRGKQT